MRINKRISRKFSDIHLEVKSIYKAASAGRIPVDLSVGPEIDRFPVLSRSAAMAIAECERPSLLPIPSPSRYRVSHSSPRFLHPAIERHHWREKYTLEAELAANEPGFSVLGDDKAKLREDRYKTRYDSRQVYKFLLPDNKPSRFVGMEVTE